MTRCRHCLAKEPARDGGCPVCGIPRDRSRQDLLPLEKKVRFYARVIRGVALLHLISGAAAAILLPGAGLPVAAAVVLAVINVVLAAGLSGYALWAYKGAVAFYFLIGIVNVISVNIPGTLVMLILLYAVGNGRAKAIFERRIC